MHMPLHLALGAPRVAAILALLTAAAHASDVHVVAPGGAGGAHATLQAAVDAAADGDVVLVRPGTYAGDVVLDARSLALFGEGRPTVVGRVLVRNVVAGEAVVVSGLDVAAPPFPGGPYRGAFDVRGCAGAVRLQDASVTGARAAGANPYVAPPTPFVTASGGPGVLADGVLDLALDNVTATGGAGEDGILFTGAAGDGGDGVLARDVARLSASRVDAVGGAGGGLDDPGDGGAGLRALGATSAHLTDTATTGGDAGCWGQQYSTQGWTTAGGPGLFVAAGATAWRYASASAGGAAAAGACAPPAGSAPGSALAGAGTFTTLPGAPCALELDAVVREGQAWLVAVRAVPGQVAVVRWTEAPGARFFPRLGHPLLLGPRPAPLHPGALTVGPGGVAALPLAAFVLPPGVDGLVFHLQAAAGPTPRGALGGARALLLLDAAF